MTESPLAEVTMLAEKTLEVRFQGHVTGALVESVVPRIALVRGAVLVRWVLFETSGVTGYRIDVRGPGGAMLTALREAGVERGVAVTKVPSVRMIGSALTLAAGLPTRFVEYRDDAERLLEAWRRGEAR